MKPVALVIGAGDALGGAIAKRFAREDFTTCVTRRQVEKLDALKTEIEAAGGICHAFDSEGIIGAIREAGTSSFEMRP